MTKMTQRTCPICGRRTMRTICRDITHTVRGQSYTVPQVTFDECTACGEQVFSPEAVRLMQSYSPSFAKRRLRASSVLIPDFR